MLDIFASVQLPTPPPARLFIVAKKLRITTQSRLAAASPSLQIVIPKQDIVNAIFQRVSGSLSMLQFLKPKHIGLTMLSPRLDAQQL